MFFEFLYKGVKMGKIRNRQSPRINSPVIKGKEKDRIILILLGFCERVRRKDLLEKIRDKKVTLYLMGENEFYIWKDTTISVVGVSFKIRESKDKENISPLKVSIVDGGGVPSGTYVSSSILQGLVS